MHNFSFFIIFRAKLGVGLLSGKYSQPPPQSKTNDDDRQGIAPKMFVHVIARGHPAFMSKRQQDAPEFILHLINVLEVTYFLYI